MCGIISSEGVESRRFQQNVYVFGAKIDSSGPKRVALSITRPIVVD
jgi:hypothetical protein